MNLGGSSGVGVTVFSGHDVNILAVLHALDATIVKHNIAPIAGGAGPMRSHWPDYGERANYLLVLMTMHIISESRLCFCLYLTFSII